MKKEEMDVGEEKDKLKRSRKGCSPVMAQTMRA